MAVEEIVRLIYAFARLGFIMIFRTLTVDLVLVIVLVFFDLIQLHFR